MGDIIGKMKKKWVSYRHNDLIKGDINDIVLLILYLYNKILIFYKKSVKYKKSRVPVFSSIFFSSLHFPIIFSYIIGLSLKTPHIIGNLKRKRVIL